MIELNNELVALDSIPRTIAEPFVLMLSPIAPHIAEELWQRLGHNSSLGYVDWPKADARYLQEESVEVAVQVNGKIRGSISVAVDAEKEKVLDEARAISNVARHLEGKQLRREIYVPGKIVNFVVG